MSPNLTTFSSDRLIQEIYSLVPPGQAPSPEVIGQLESATAQLLILFKADGKLDQSPSALAMNRSVDLHEKAARSRLEGQRVLVTGGSGCVGSRLIPLLLSLGASQIAIVDIAEPPQTATQGSGNSNIVFYRVDIRDVSTLDQAFTDFQPAIVYHLASIREPGRAEAVVREAIETNVFGTRNVIAACLKHGVKDAVYSSTGKCFAYVSDHVYTSSKKLAEGQWVAAAREATDTRFRITRFTHIMENGVVAADIAQGIADGLLALHGPDRYFNIQNLRQATHLLLNALALADQTPPDGFWSAVDLGWPVNTMELALYGIERSGKKVAVYFSGVPKGYDEAFFRGNFAWDNETSYHPLINALEASSGFGDTTTTMVGARVQPFSAAKLDAELQRLAISLADPSLDVVEVKRALTDAVNVLAGAIFAETDVLRLIDVLWWGAAPIWAGAKAQDARRFVTVIGLLTTAVLNKLKDSGASLSPGYDDKLRDIAQTLAQLDGLADKGVALFAHVAPRPLAPAQDHARLAQA